jgi:hypothetical protein
MKTYSSERFVESYEDRPFAYCPTVREYSAAIWML